MLSPKQVSLQVLTGHWNGNLPVDPVAIAKKLGVSVNPVCDSAYSGKAYLERGIRIIEYNGADPVLRQRFAIAHALGHHLLTHTDETHSFDDDPSKFSLHVASHQEAEANQFAAELLMPEMAVEHLIFKKNITSLDELAKLFSVSTVAIQYRLKMLGLL
jgi:Zn-dependent peptidase ImmA (M78 family)